MRRTTAWLVALPLMVAGSQAAHALAYRLVYPQAHVRLAVLAASGHSYARLLPLLLGAASAVAMVGLAWTAVDASRGGRPRPLPPLAFALLPLLAYTLQETCERWLALGGLPWWLVLQPTFRVGLLLQLPFALAAFLLARLLVGGAVHAGRLLAAPVVPPRRRATATRTRAASAPAHGLLRADPRTTRGPPARLLPTF